MLDGYAARACFPLTSSPFQQAWRRPLKTLPMFVPGPVSPMPFQLQRVRALQETLHHVATSGYVVASAILRTQRGGKPHGFSKDLELARWGGVQYGIKLLFEGLNRSAKVVWGVEINSHTSWWSQDTV